MAAKTASVYHGKKELRRHDREDVLDKRHIAAPRRPAATDAGKVVMVGVLAVKVTEERHHRLVQHVAVEHIFHEAVEHRDDEKRDDEAARGRPQLLLPNRLWCHQLEQDGESGERQGDCQQKDSE